MSDAEQRVISTSHSELKESVVLALGPRNQPAATWRTSVAWSNSNNEWSHPTIIITTPDVTVLSVEQTPNEPVSGPWVPGTPYSQTRVNATRLQGLNGARSYYLPVAGQSYAIPPGEYIHWVDANYVVSGGGFARAGSTLRYR